MPLPIPTPDPKQVVLQTEDWIEYRTGFPTLVRKFLFRKVPPTGWFHTLGSSLLTVFIIQAVTGSLLAMTYDPSPNGAYQSIRYITDQETLGWLIRGMH
jgi:ubiquinol-cytochrome c reductase cytochrome b subunit